MRITPLDVRKQEFRKAVRGFDCDEVRAFLSTLAEEYETVLVDNKQLRERIMDQDEKINEYKTLERTLRDTLLTAQRVMEETKDNANHKGELIVQDARMKARQIMEECRLRTEELRREIEGLRKEKETYLARFKSLAQAQIQFVDTHSKDFGDLDRRLTHIVDTVFTGTEQTLGEVEEEIALGQLTEVEPAAPAAVHPVAPAPAPAPFREAPYQGAPEIDVWRDYQPGAEGPRQAAASFSVAPRAPAPKVEVPAPAQVRSAAPVDAEALQASDEILATVDLAAGVLAETEARPAAAHLELQMPWDGTQRPEALAQAGRQDPVVVNI